MFIDIGNGNVIRSSTIIAIIEYELISSSLLLQEMVNHTKEEKTLKGPTEEVKSMIVTTESTYLSSLSTTTLKKRTSIRSLVRKLEDYTDDH